MPSDEEVARRILAEADPAIDQARAAFGEPEPRGGGPGEAYKRYVADPLHDLLSRGMAHAGVPQGARNFIAGAVVPDTLTGAGIAGGAMLVPPVKMGMIAGTAARNAPKLLPFVERMAGPTAGGLLGGIAEKGDPVDAAVGTAEGLATGGFGEIFSAMGARVAKSRLGRYFMKKDPETLGKAIEDVVQDFPSMRTPEEFQSAVWGNVAQNKLSSMYDGEISTLSRAVGDHVAKIGGSPRPASAILGSELTLFDPRGNIHSPVIRELKSAGVLPKGATTFDDLTEAIRDLRLKGRSPKGDPKLTLDGKQARMYADELSNEVSSALGTISPSLAKRYQQMDMRYSQGAEMLRFLKQPGLVDENGNLNMRLLQETFKKDRGTALARRFTAADVKTLSDALFRGAPATATDVLKRAASGPGESIGVGKLRIFGRIEDLLKGPDFAGSYDLPLPYISPKALALGAQRTAGGIGYAVNKPNTLLGDSEE